MKYREKIDRKLAHEARKPTGALCDLDPLDEEIFGNKKDSEESESEGEKEPKVKKNKKKKTKGKKNHPEGAENSNMFNDILAVSDDGSDADE